MKKNAVAACVAIAAAAYLTTKKAKGWFKKAHVNIVMQALEILKNDEKRLAVSSLEPFSHQLLIGATIPDNKGDRDNGSGYHYYSPINKFGLPTRTYSGYYPNRLGSFSKSAGTMLEENYTMALIFWQNGKKNTACVLLGRALHFLSDICCVPHTTSRVCNGGPYNCHMMFEQEANKYIEEYKAYTADGFYELYGKLSLFEIANRLAEYSSKDFEKLIRRKRYDYEEITSRAFPLAQIAAAAFLEKFITDAHGKIIIDENSCYAFRNYGSGLYLHSDLSLSEEKEFFKIIFQTDGSLALEGTEGEFVPFSKNDGSIHLTFYPSDVKKIRITCTKKYSRTVIDVPVIKRAGHAPFRPGVKEHYWILEDENDEL